MFGYALKNSMMTVTRNLSLSTSRFGGTLVIAEHNGGKLSPSVLNTISAASQLKTDSITCLLTGQSCGGAASELAKVSGVSKVLVAEADVLKGSLPGILYFSQRFIFIYLFEQIQLFYRACH